MSRKSSHRSHTALYQRTHARPARFTQALSASGAVIEEKSNPAFAGLTIINDVPQPHTMPRNYRNYAVEGYAANDSVYKCVNYIVTNGAAIPPKLYTDATMETEITAHPLLDRLARPNQEQDGVTFREAILGWYHIAGNAFLYAIRPGSVAGGFSVKGAPDELWTLDPNKVHPEPHPTQGITGYKYDDFDDDHNPIPPANIGHLRTWNPKDPIFGLSPIEVAALMVDQQNAARKWNLALLQNYAKPSGAWVTEAALAKNERDRLEERINEKLTGARNAGRVPVLDAGAKWTPTSLPPSELDWLKSLQYNAGQIANIFNIPPQLIGDTSATTYNNMEQAKAASYTEAIFPALDKLYSLLTMWLVPMYPDLCDSKGQPRAYLSYDKETVEVVQSVIQERKNAQADRAINAYQAGVITLNQAQEMQGLPDLGKKGDVYRIGAVLVPADKLDEYAEQSLAEPAAPPIAVAEPLPPGTPGATPGQPGQPGQEQPPPSDDDASDDSADDASDTADDDEEDDEDTPPKKPSKKPSKKNVRRLRRSGKALGNFDFSASSDGSVTHLVWECDGGPCAFCLDNDGAVVEADENGDAVEAFPNGCSSPDDSHRFCECVVHQLSVPDDASDDLFLMSMDDAVSVFGVGTLASRHDRDVAAQQQAQQSADESGGDDSDVTYALSKRQPRKAGKMSRAAYRRWMETVS